jgi:uncharacterized protein YggU (UPF0235/DUF167 family)
MATKDQEVTMARRLTQTWPELAITGAEFECLVKPGGRKNEILREGDRFRVTVTAMPEDGKANDAVRDLLATALDVAKTRLTLIQGATSRQKLFRLD